MPPRSIVVPQGSFACHSKHLLERTPSKRFASSLALESPSAPTALWHHGNGVIGRQARSVTGAQEWQTSAYSWNKQNIKTLPVAALNLEKLIEGYTTMKVVDNKGKDPRTIRSALAARRKHAEKVYVSKPRIKDYGDRVEVTAFVFDAHKQAAEQKALFSRDKQASRTGQTGSLTDLILNPQQQTGLQGLIARIYGKPVDLKLIELKKPHLDADILSRVVAQRLKDRRNTPRRVIRDATWRAPLPTAQAVANILQAKAQARPSTFSFSDFTMGNLGQTTSGVIQKKLMLSQVSSIEVEAAGRLTKRLTANRSNRKMARIGTNKKGANVMLRGFRKAHVQYAFTGAKRRVGQFGIRVTLGHA